MKYSELDAVKFLPNFTMEQFGKNCFIYDKPTKADIEVARQGLKRMKEVLSSGEYDVVVMDEINIALFYKLFSVDEVLDIIDKRDPHVEVVLTGRYAPKEIIDKADLVTEMKEIKHYYTQGVMARKGIES